MLFYTQCRKFHTYRNSIWSFSSVVLKDFLRIRDFNIDDFIRSTIFFPLSSFNFISTTSKLSNSAISITLGVACFIRICDSMRCSMESLKSCTAIKKYTIKNSRRLEYKIPISNSQTILVQATIESAVNQRLNHKLMDFSVTSATIKSRKSFFRISQKEKK